MVNYATEEDFYAKTATPDVVAERISDRLDMARRVLGIKGYQEVARRLGIMPEETNISEVNFGKTIPIKFKKK